VGGMGALVGRHVFLSDSWTVRGCGGCTKKESERKELAVSESGVVVAVVGFCAVYRHSVVCTCAGALPCLRESIKRVDRVDPVSEGCIQCF